MNSFIQSLPNYTPYEHKLMDQYRRIADCYKRQQHIPHREERAWKRLKQAQAIHNKLMKKLEVNREN